MRWLLTFSAACAGGDADSASKVGDQEDAGGGRADDTGEDSATEDSAVDTGPDTATPIDADGDGVAAGGDCDDGDPAVYPGAPDWCDGVDQDCDGELQGDGMCSEPTSWDWLATRAWVGVEPDGGFGALIAYEFDGEVALRMAVGQFTGTSASSKIGAEGFIPALPASEEEEWLPRAMGVWVDHYDTDTHVEQVHGAGDVDGDGFDDVWVGIEDLYTWEYSIGWIAGPSTSWPHDGAYIDEEVDAIWASGVDEDRTFHDFGQIDDAGRDIDGDGRADLITSGKDGLVVLFGEGNVPGTQTELAEETVLNPDVSFTSPTIGSDMDGDGFEELFCAGYHDVFGVETRGLWWTDGAALRSADGASISDVSTFVPPSGDGVYFSTDSRQPVVGDLDHDGVDDLLSMRHPAGESDEACIVWLSGSELPGASAIDDAILVRACADDDVSALYSNHVRSDADGDGVTEVSIGFDRTERDYFDEYRYQWSLACPLLSTRLPLGGTLDEDDYRLCYYGLTAILPDLDQDGLAEMVGNKMATEDADEKDQNFGRADILMGFAIPWDDPSKW